MSEKLCHDERAYPPSERILLREYVEALFREKERALDMAAAERDRAAEVLRDEQRRALLVAETEREKAAAALRAGTDRAIADNYSRLEEKLEGLRREVSIEFDGRDTALTELKTTTMQYKADQNEWRGTVSDVAQKAKEDTRDYVDGKFEALMPRLTLVEKILAETRAGRAAIFSLIAGAIGVIGLAVAIAAFVAR